MDGWSTLSFDRCLFEKLTIINEDEIAFKHISINFFSCIIGEIELGQVASDNISIGFYRSFVSGKIASGNLLAVEFNNCRTLSHMFLIDVPKIRISHTKENIEPNHWQGLLLQFYQSNEFLKAPIRYQIYHPRQIDISSNYDSREEPIKPVINIFYNQEAGHQATKITGMSLSSFSISGNPGGAIRVENSRINNWYIHNFLPEGNVSFYSVAPVSTDSADAGIGIHDSMLDGVEFDNIAFDAYPIISFHRTKFSKAIFTSCDFPKDYKTFSAFVPIANVHYPDNRPPNYEKAQYEIFLQLKKAVEDRGNYYEAQKLQAIAHDALKQIKTISWADRLILSVNHWSNNHGLSIKRPFWGFLIFSVSLYLLYLLSVGRLFNSNTFDPKLIGYYFSFVDITHRSDFLVRKDELTGWSLFLDYLGKLIVGFFIYQFIAAFRKYGKRL